MLIKGILTQMSGSLGGITAAHNRGGMYLRGRAIPTDPASERQMAMRMYLSMASTEWESALTPEQRDAWSLYASNVPVLNALGDAIHLSGQQMFVRTASARMQASLAAVLDAPTTFNIGDPPMPTGVSVLYDNTLNITIPAITDGDFTVFMGRPQDPSISFFRGPWRLATVSAATGGSIVLAAALYPFVLAEGQRIWLAMRRAYDDGRLSERITIGPIEVGAA